MTASRRALTFGSVVLTAVLTCSACGSSAPSVASARQQYETIVANTNKALTRDRSVTHPDQSFAKYAKDFKAAATQLAAVTFPASATKDAKALVTELNLLAADASKVAAAAAKNQKVEKNVVAFAQLNLKLMEEEKREMTAANTLRHDLGLPPESTSTTTQPATLGTTTTVPSLSPTTSTTTKSTTSP